MRTLGYLSAFAAAAMGAAMSIVDMPIISLPSAPERRWKGRRTSKYMPHQGKRECARRIRQGLV